ncbi:MAG TPA: hypothetical protein VF715_03840 [Thermoleophilaceae bacterium]
MRRALLTIVAALALAALAAAPAQAAKRKVPHGFYGAIWADPIVDAPPAEREPAWDRLAEAGVESIRALFHWGHAQPNRGASFDWSRTDYLVTEATQRNMKIVPTVMYAPGWAKQYPDKAQSPPARESDYAAFVGELVKRYGPAGTFWKEHPELPKRPLRDWQIWNEPTLSDHWWRTGSWYPKEAKRYGALLRASSRAAKKVDKGARIVMAGLTNNAWGALHQLYKGAGVRGAFDVAAVHMFPGKWRNVAVIVKRIRAELDEHGDRKLPIWVTEMTWPAAEGRAPTPDWAQSDYYRNFVTTEKGAASRLKAAYGLLGGRSFRTRNRLERVLWFSAATSYTGGWIFDYSGLMGFDGSNLSTKPSYDAFRASARAAQGCAKSAAGSCR